MPSRSRLILSLLQRTSAGSSPCTTSWKKEPGAKSCCSPNPRNLSRIFFYGSAPDPGKARLTDRCHPLIRAVHSAFAQHLPLTLSPDCIWLVIEQGFAHHVTENTEALRRRLVRHDGKRELVATVHDLSLSSFESAISSFSSQIRDQSDPVLHDTLICNFSTTTPAIRTAFEVVLMDTYSGYFDYMMLSICGIPKITLTGTVEDWQRIRDRVEVLETFGLSWWIDRLRPILDQFIRTAEGTPDLEFWQAICKPKYAYGGDVITGWIADLFPYLSDAPRRTRNPVFRHERHNWALPVEEGLRTHPFEPGSEKGIAPTTFPSGLASVPVQLRFPNNPSLKVDLMAGFLAVEQDPQTLALSPLIGWSVTEPA